MQLQNLCFVLVFNRHSVSIGVSQNGPSDPTLNIPFSHARGTKYTHFAQEWNASAQERKNEQTGSQQVAKMPQQEFLKKLIGKSEGHCRNWFEPDKLADDSKIAGEFAGVLDSRFVWHTYQSTIRKKTRHGEELIAFNTVTKAF